MSMARAQIAAATALPAGLDIIDARIIDHLQDGIALTGRPFTRAAMRLEIDEADLLARLHRLLRDGFATRFGPLINADAAGGAYMLAALAAPQERFEEVANIVNGFAEVAHNYARDHHFNMWFVLAAASRQRVQEVADAIERRTGLRVLRLPKLREYFVDFRVRLLAEQPLSSGDSRISRKKPAHAALTEADKDLLAVMQAGLEPVADVWAQPARRLGMTEDDVLRRLRKLLDAGVIRRIALVPNHYRLGLRANGMTVWDVDDAHIDALGTRLGELPFVSHCYHRPRQPGWRYNLFAMVHGHNGAEMQMQVAQLAQLLSDAARAGEVLRSTRILKKSGVRLFAEEAARQPGED